MERNKKRALLRLDTNCLVICVLENPISFFLDYILLVLFPRVFVVSQTIVGILCLAGQQLPGKVIAYAVAVYNIRVSHTLEPYEFVIEPLIVVQTS